MWKPIHQQGQRLETVREFAANGKYQIGTRGTVVDVSDYPGKLQPTFSVVFDGETTPIQFNMLTASGLFRRIDPTDPLDSLVDAIMDLAREHPIDEVRIYIKDRIEKDAINPYRSALKRAKETIRQFNGLGMSGKVEQACWDAYQHSPEMKQINEALARESL
jgi:hypothetical protein